ncbi:MAG: radical SAM protein [Deltaproteobacteria bacterium]|nr:radical SAM protein [Deltaproteobacteria bacterium]
MEGRTAPHYPAAMINVTNRCNLKCRHCFVFREDNPNARKQEMDDETMLGEIRRIRDRHGIVAMLWMGGEPLLRPGVLREGVKLFSWNTITTNGTLDLLDLPGVTYVVSLDGPKEYNDSIRGKGSFDRVMKTLSRVPEDFSSKVMVQCVVTRQNEDLLEELVELLVPTRAEGMTFSFYVPPANDVSPLTWGTLTRRDKAVREALRLKKKHPDFIWNGTRQLELTLSENAPAITANCPSKKYVLPLYLDGGRFESPFCCYGDDVDCDLCGGWVVFYLAAKLEGAK